ncbi:DUF3040 domain-containing protein [Schumannella sp. 10F1B-5-1]|uniref:DUF3040 domain-containing protein n=1 Tax=Schumannella sp. 10F1B-5-1 TaxID=2590780 RepID=UPI0011328B69|nr:DUF3040 domain-containing protein [Schumannella sp. 10F1B-5-1]TPW73799.1 DUF3040 domain-containing protein [Schumannella sp. 10F1B-5-1]
MPLSEQEQRLLDEMERNLYQNDADFVATVGSGRARPSVTVIALGVLAAVVGLGLLIVGVAMHQPLIGALGFVLMFGGALFAISPPKRFRGAPAPKPAREGGLLHDLGERFEHRRDGERDS